MCRWSVGNSLWSAKFVVIHGNTIIIIMIVHGRPWYLYIVYSHVHIAGECRYNDQSCHGCLFVSVHINYYVPVCKVSIIEIEHNHIINNACTASAHYTNCQFGDGARLFVYLFICKGYEKSIHLCRNISYGSFRCSRQSAAGVRYHHGKYQKNHGKSCIEE